MSTTNCETGIVRIRVGLFNDILRFVRALCIILYGESYCFIFNCTGSFHTTTQRNADTHTHTHSHIPHHKTLLSHTHKHTHTYSLTHTHTDTHTHSHSHSHIHTLTHTHTYENLMISYLCTKFLKIQQGALALSDI